MSKEHKNGEGLPRTPSALLPDTEARPVAPPEKRGEPTYTEAFPLAEANDWIRRWKAANGGFYCHPQPDGSVMVQLAYQHGNTPIEIEEAIDRIQPLQDELLGKPDLKSAVTTIVADTWHNARRPADGSA